MPSVSGDLLLFFIAASLLGLSVVWLPTGWFRVTGENRMDYTITNRISTTTIDGTPDLLE